MNRSFLEQRLRNKIVKRTSKHLIKPTKLSPLLKIDLSYQLPTLNIALILTILPVFILQLVTSVDTCLVLPFYYLSLIHI